MILVVIRTYTYAVKFELQTDKHRASAVKKDYKRVTTSTLTQMKQNGDKISMLTAYDYTLSIPQRFSISATKLLTTPATCSTSKRVPWNAEFAVVEPNSSAIG